MTGITRGRLPRLVAAASIVAAGVLTMPALAGATPSGNVDKVDLGAGETLSLKGKCDFDGKPGKVIGVISLLNKKTTVSTSFSAWAEAEKDGSFAVGVKLSKTVTVEESYVAGVLCVSKDKKKHKVIRDTLRCGRPKPPKPHPTTTRKPATTTTTKAGETTTTTKAGGSTTSTTEAPETETPTPTPEEVEKIIETVAKPKITAAATAVKATPKFTG
jgi:hypothetical protein